MPNLVARLINHPHNDHGTIEINQKAHDAFIAALNSKLPPGAGAKSAPNLFPTLLNLALVDLKQLVANAGGIDQAIAIAQKAYNDYIAPIDLPNIPNLIEPAFDMAMSYAIGVIMRSAWARIQDAPVDPTPAPTPVPAPSPAVGSASPS